VKVLSSSSSVGTCTRLDVYFHAPNTTWLNAMSCSVTAGFSPTMEPTLLVSFTVGHGIGLPLSVRITSAT
jgi:hypothetical protein